MSSTIETLSQLNAKNCHKLPLTSELPRSVHGYVEFHDIWDVKVHVVSLCREGIEITSPDTMTSWRQGVSRRAETRTSSRYNLDQGVEELEARGDMEEAGTPMSAWSYEPTGGYMIPYHSRAAVVHRVHTSLGVSTESSARSVISLYIQALEERVLPYDPRSPHKMQNKRAQKVRSEPERNLLGADLTRSPNARLYRLDAGY